MCATEDSITLMLRAGREPFLMKVFEWLLILI